MRIRVFLPSVCVLAVVPLLLWAWPATTISGFTAQDGPEAAHSRSGKGGFEVWIADQSDTRPGFGGQLVIYEVRT